MYLIANGLKYDVTKFIDIHPGGKNCILKNENKDCTYHYKMHSNSAKKKWDTFCVNNKFLWYRMFFT